MKLRVKQPKGRLGQLLKTCLLETSSYLTISLFFPWPFLILWCKRVKRECFWTRFSLLFIFLASKLYPLILPNPANIGMPFRSIQGTCMLMDIILEFYHFEISVCESGIHSKLLERIVVWLHFSCWDAGGNLHWLVSRHEYQGKQMGKKWEQ